MGLALSRWKRIGTRMPKSVGDIGFPMTLRPRDPETARVFPRNSTEVWPRTSPGGKPATYVTCNAGRSWKRQDNGLSQSQGWFTVKLQVKSADTHQPVRLYFGTTGGEIWASRNEGDKWTCIARPLPHIYAIETVELT